MQHAIERDKRVVTAFNAVTTLREMLRQEYGLNKAETQSVLNELVDSSTKRDQFVSDYSESVSPSNRA